MPDGGQPGIDEAGVRAALDELMAWEPMRRSPRLSAFLSYVVLAELRGEGSAVKAYAIAVDVFDRGEDFDPQTDPIVRVQARRLRTLLKDFDQGRLGKAPVRILIPVGRYVPEFLPRAALGPQSAERQNYQPVPTDSARPPHAATPPIWMAGAIAALVLLAALYFWPELGRPTGATMGVAQPQEPLVIVEEFENLTDDQRGEPLVAGLAVELVTDLNLFPDLSARYGGAQAQSILKAGERSGAVFVLSGVARRSPRGILYSVLVRSADDNAVVATFEITAPLGTGQPELGLQDVSTLFALRLGSPRGPLHANVRAWLAGEQASAAVFEPYACLAAFAAFRENRLEIDTTRLFTCARDGESAQALAILATLTADEGWRLGADTTQGAARIAEGRRLAQDAIDGDPTSAFNWAQRGYVAFLAGDVGEARDFYNAAVQLNPAMVDVIADYAYVDALLGNWAAAEQWSERALSAEPDPPDFYASVPALGALRSGDYAQALESGEIMVQGLPELGAALMVATGGHLRDANVVNAYLPRLLASQRYRRLGIMPALRTHVSDPELLRQLSSGILQAGVPIDRLVEPFQ